MNDIEDNHSGSWWKPVSKVKTRLNTLDFRTKRIGLGFASGLAIKLVSAVSGLITLPLLISYLGTDTYGMMMTIVGFLGVTGHADLGVGHGLQNLVPRLQHDPVKLKKAISTALVLLTGIGLIIALSGWLAIQIDFLTEWVGLADQAGGANFQNSFLAALVCFAIAIPINVVGRVQAGLQQTHLSNVWAIGGFISSLIGTLLGIWLHASPAQLIILIYGTQALAQLGNLIHLFGWKRTDLKPAFNAIDSHYVGEVLRVGLSFFAVHAAFAIFVALDNIILAKYAGYAAVTIFTIGLRLINLYASPLLALVGPTLPAINDAIANNDLEWARNSVQRVGFLSIAGGVAAAVFFALTTNYILTIWLGGEIEFGKALLISFAVYTIYMFITHATSYIMMAESLYRKYRYIYPCAIAISIAAKFWATAEFGLLGLLYSTAISMTLFFLVPSMLEIRKSLTE